MASRRARSKVLISGTVAAVVVAGGGVAWATTRNSDPSYRLATASRSDVSQTVTEVGAISSADQATLAFPVSGTVGSVRVKVGDAVAAGHTVATLDTAALSNAVQLAKSSLADAQERLAADQAAQTATTTAATTSRSTNSLREIALVVAVRSPAPSPSPSPSPSRSSAPGRGGGGGGGSFTQAKAAVTRAQHAVVSSQTTVDALLDGPASSDAPHVLTSDIAALKTACASSTVTFTTVSSPSGTINATITGAGGLPVSLVDGTDAAGAPVAATTVAGDGSYSFGSATDRLKAGATYTVRLGDDRNGVSASQTCTVALTQVQDDERALATAEKRLDGALGDLGDAVSAYLAAVESSTGSGSGSGSGSGGRPTGSGSAGGSRSSSASSGGGHSAGTGTRSSSNGSSGGTGSSGSGTSGSSTGAGRTITAEQIAADQKAIDAANAELAVAEQNLDQGVLVTPIAGTVAALGMTAGAAVSAGSSTATVTVIGKGQKKITTTVGIADIDLVKKGDSVTVTVDGVSSTLTGTVTLIGIMNTSGTSGTTTTYPVTVLLDPTNRALYDGAGATVAIHVGTKKNVLTVPASAVHRSAFATTVNVYAGGKVTATRVQTGVRGLGSTQIVSGLTAGARVVLAVVSDPVPSSTSGASLRRGGSALVTGTGTGRFIGGTGGR